MNKSSFTIAALVAIASAVNISSESQSQSDDDGSELQSIFPEFGFAQVADDDADYDAIFPDLSLAEVDSEQRHMVMAQTSRSRPSNWETVQGTCVDSNNDFYDYWEVLGVTNGWGQGGIVSVDKCRADCDQTPGCVGINYSRGLGRCGLRVEDHVQVNIHQYETPWHHAWGKGPAARGTGPAGDWVCEINPLVAQEYDVRNWEHHQGMCVDSNNQQYDYFEVHGIRNGWGGGGYISLEQCAADCLATPQCVGLSHSPSAGRCGLRVENHAQVTLPDYETPWHVGSGVGRVAGAAFAGDWSCYVNPRMGSHFTCDETVNFMHPGPAYQQISLTDACGTGDCAGNPVYGPISKEGAIQYCQDECTRRTTSGQACEGFFFQKHNNGHEICGFYGSGMESGSPVNHGHQYGAICKIGHQAH